MKQLLMILKLLPTVLEAVVAVESVIGAGKGQTKKALIVNSISDGAKVTAQAPDDTVQMVSSMIDGIVSTLNAVGVFKNTDSPQLELPK